MDRLVFKEQPGHSSASRRVVVIRPRTGFLQLDLATIWRYRELLGFLVWRELKVRYKQAAIGAAWALLQPLMAVTIFTVIFGYFAKLPSDGVPYPVFALAALLPWAYFAESLHRASIGLVSDADLVRKIYFPRLVIPFAMVIAPIVDLAVSFVVLLAFMAWYGLAPTWNVLFLPIFIFQASVLALGLGLWLGPINVRFRDVKYTLPFLIQIWLYASPVVYSSNMIPEQWKLLYSLNPMVGVIEGFRWCLLATPHPDFGAIVVSQVISFVIGVGGLVYFKRMERFFADVI